MTQPHPFRRALEAEDVEAMVATLRPDVVFHGPAVQRPIVGRADVIGLLQAVVASFRAFTQEFRDGPRTALVFEARVRDRLVQGVSLLEDDEHGRIKTITVMIRPLSGRTARGDAVRAQGAQPRVGSITPPAAGRHNANAGRGRSVAAPGMTGRQIRPSFGGRVAALTRRTERRPHERS
jgi:SnoaL-like domain